MILSLLVLTVSSFGFKKQRKIAETAPEELWFYKQLTKYQKPFYEALEYWRKNNMLSSAPKMYLDSDENIQNHVEQDIIRIYSYGGSNALNIHFLSAIAAWRHDHPELFYVDVSHLTMRLSLEADNKYKILFGCLSYPSLLLDFVEPSKLNQMITDFNSKVDEMVKSANGKQSITDKVKAIHDYVVKTQYTRIYNTDDINVQNWIHESYGSLVNGKSVCDGYAKSFQIAMNILGIPSVLVSGDALDEKNESESHAWNLVQIENIWYVVDCTYDSTTKTNRWLLVTQDKTYYTHFPDGQLDHCGVTFHYPPATFPDMNKWYLDFTVNEKNEQVEVKVSYEGKNTTALLKDHLRLFMKLTLVDSTNGVLDEKEWIDIRLYSQAFGGEDVFDRENHTYFIYNKIYAFQFGLAYDDVKYHNGTDFLPEQRPYFVNSSDIAFLSDVKYTGFDFSDFEIPQKSFPPSVRYYSPTPRIFWPGAVYNFVFTITEPIVPLDDHDKNFEKFNVSLTAVSRNSYDRLQGKAEKVGEDAVKMSTVREAKVVNNNTISVIIKTSDSYAHDEVTYFVHFNGVKGVLSLMEPTPFEFTVTYRPNNGGTNTCTKMFGSGTLYTAGRPILIADGDIRDNDFKVTDKDGKEQPAKGATSKDIALVATRKDGEEGGDYSATFDISLSCFCIDYLIKPGTYNCPLTIQLPFPDGFDPEANKDVSFEVIHFKGDGVEEHNTVVVGPTGLLITVTSFSPFRIQQKTTTDDSTETSYPLYTSSTGGLPEIKIGEEKISNKVIKYNSGDTIKVTLKEGTVVEKIFLNSKSLEVNDKIEFTIDTSLLNAKSNILEVFVVNSDVVESEKGKQVFFITENISKNAMSQEAKENDKDLIFVQAPNIAEYLVSTSSNSNNNNNNNNNPNNGKNKNSKKLSGGAIAGIVIGVVAFVAIVAVVVILVIKNRAKAPIDNDSP